MKTGALLSLAVALGACSAEPVGHKWQVDEQGKPIPGSESPIWTEQEAVEVRRQAIQERVFYNVDCGTMRTPMSGEVLLFDGGNFTAECKAMAGHPVPGGNMYISFNDPAARWTSGKSWNDQVSSLKARRHEQLSGQPVGMCIRLWPDVTGSGTPMWRDFALFTTEPRGTLDMPSMSPWGGASFMVVRYKPLTEAECGI